MRNHWNEQMATFQEGLHVQQNVLYSGGTSCGPGMDSSRKQESANKVLVYCHKLFEVLVQRYGFRCIGA
jgi:hypothetical protein